MTYEVRHGVPETVQIGVDQTLTLDVYDRDTQAQVTIDSGTIQVMDGSEEVVALTAVTSVGPPATYSLSSSVTTSRNLSDRWLLIWPVTIGGVAYTFQRTAYLVRRKWYPTVTQADLVRRHRDLANMLASGQTSWTDKIVEAEEYMERALIRKGNRPHLIFDSWALADAERALKLWLIFRDLAHNIGDGRYADLAAEYQEEWLAEFKAANFRYDANETGTVDDCAQVTTQPPLLATAGVRRWRGR